MMSGAVERFATSSWDSWRRRFWRWWATSFCTITVNEQVAKQFLAELNAHNYQAAYQIWCPKACENYSYRTFRGGLGEQKDQFAVEDRFHRQLQSVPDRECDGGWI